MSPPYTTLLRRKRLHIGKRRQNLDRNRRLPLPHSSNPSANTLAPSRNVVHTPTGHFPTEATRGPGSGPGGPGGGGGALPATNGNRASTGDASAAPAVLMIITANETKILIV